MKFSTKTRDAIHRRAGGACEVCGVTLRIYSQIHHRRPRGMGGSKQQATGAASNGLYVHQKCHERIERNRSDALDKGWIVRQSDEPAEIPVRLWHGWALLDDSGAVQMIPQIKSALDYSPPEGVVEVVPDGVVADHPEDGSLADA